MKKKIKNLTLEQAYKLCESHLDCDSSGKFNCHNCPYFDKYKEHCKLEYAYLDEYGNEKIEVFNNEK